MVDIRVPPRIENLSTEDSLLYGNNWFHPASGWGYLMRRNAQEILPGVFLGPYSAALNEYQDFLHKQGITHIVCIRDSSEAHFIKPQLENFTYLTLEIADSEYEGILKHVPIVNSFIRKALAKKTNVLVHGNAGISRSASFVIAYVMERLNYSYMHALKYVKLKRGCINPNPGFAAQLNEYEMIFKTYRRMEMQGQCSRERKSTKRRCEEPNNNNMQTLCKKIHSDINGTYSQVDVLL